MLLAVAPVVRERPVNRVLGMLRRSRTNSRVRHSTAVDIVSVYDMLLQYGDYSRRVRILLVDEPGHSGRRSLPGYPHTTM